jgi:WD40 repeat protein
MKKHFKKFGLIFVIVGLGIGGLFLVLFSRPREIQSRDGFTHALFFSNETLIAVERGNTIGLWDIVRGRKLRSFEIPHPQPSQKIWWITISSDGSHLFAGGQDLDVCIWDTATGELVGALSGHRNGALAFAVSPEGKSGISSDLNNVVKLWDLKKLTVIRESKHYGTRVNALEFSADERALLIADPYFVSLWNLETFSLVRKYDCMERAIICSTFSPTKKSFFTGDWEHRLVEWDIESSNALRKHGHFGGKIMSIVFSKDGTKLLVGSAAGNVVLFDFPSLREIRRFTGSGIAILSPNGETVVSFSKSRSLLIWKAK